MLIMPLELILILPVLDQVLIPHIIILFLHSSSHSLPVLVVERSIFGGGDDGISTSQFSIGFEGAYVIKALVGTVKRGMHAAAPYIIPDYGVHTACMYIFYYTDAILIYYRI